MSEGCDVDACGGDALYGIFVDLSGIGEMEMVAGVCATHAETAEVLERSSEIRRRAREL
jgi:hypothetical protein